MNTGIDPLIDENAELLTAGAGVMTAIAPELYRAGHDCATRGGVGKHFRHILEFYEQLIQRQDGTVDYQLRQRDPRVEQDAAYAAELVTQVVSLLDQMRGLSSDTLLTVVTEVYGADGAPVRTASTLGRELAALASHTVHHYAIVAMLLRQGGVTPPEGFGIAPSTLRHLNAQSR